jgi:hypothetical protein
MTFNAEQDLHTGEVAGSIPAAPTSFRRYGWQTGRCARDSEEPRRHTAHDHATARVRKVPTITRDRRMQRLANFNPSYLQVISC